MKLLRWKAIVPVGLLVAAVVTVWILFLDKAVEKSIESIGAELVGAKVDVADADVSILAGRVSIRGLEAANPDAPMSNLVQVDEITADVRVGALLKKKMIIEQLSVRGVRFGTARSTSGALENPDSNSGRVMREVSSWGDRVRIPPLNLDGIGTVVDVGAISTDSLQTINLAIASVADADSSSQEWEAALSRLDPGPVVDSARNLINRINSSNPLSLGLSGVSGLASSTRNTLTTLRDMQSNLTSLDSTVRSGVSRLQGQVSELSSARAADYQYALGLLQLPSLETPDVSNNIFGDMAINKLKPVLYWLQQVERFLPPGLDPRRVSGDDRSRRSGTTVIFPDPNGEPGFLVESADADVEIGSGSAAGIYAARLTGLTTEPSVYGRPLEMLLERSGGTTGPSDVRLTAMLDHVSENITDSVALLVQGLSLPHVDLNGLGANLNMGLGASELILKRTGDSLVGSWSWSSESVEWARIGSSGSNEGGGISDQAGDVVSDFLWRTVSSLSNVEVQVSFIGSVEGPSLSINSNVGRAIAEGLRRELGREVQRAETQVRAEVDRLVSTHVNSARDRVGTLQTGIESRVGVQLDQLTNVRAELERALRRLVPGGLQE